MASVASLSMSHHLYNYTPTPSPVVPSILVAPPRRESDIARIIQVFGNTRARKNGLMHDYRFPGLRVDPWPEQLIYASSTELRTKVVQMFEESTPFNDSTADLSFEDHKYAHTKEEWLKIIDLAMSRLFTHDALKQCEQRHLACWMSCASRKGPSDNYPHFMIGRHGVRICKYLRFLVCNPIEREVIWENVGDNGIHCSHLCHNTLCINPYHMIIETNIENQVRNKCLYHWRSINTPRWGLHGAKKPLVCSAVHDPKCIFTDYRTGFLVPEYNFRKVDSPAFSTELSSAAAAMGDIGQGAAAAAAAAAGPFSASAAAAAIPVSTELSLMTYQERDPSKNTLAGLLQNWRQLGTKWEKDMVARWQGAEWRVAHGNYRVQHRQAEAAQEVVFAANRLSAKGSSPANPIILD